MFLHSKGVLTKFVLLLYYFKEVTGIFKIGLGSKLETAKIKERKWVSKLLVQCI